MTRDDERWQDQSLPRRASSVVAQRASESVVLLHLDSGRYFSLEGTGDRVWQLCDGEHPLAEIVRTISAEYQADPTTVRADAVELLEDLASEGLIDDAR